MSIGDLFRSKTKHSDPAVRAEAVGELGPDNLDLLTEIVREDADAEIRSLALDKIDDCDALIELSRVAAAPTDRRAVDRAGQLLARGPLAGEEGEAVATAIAKIAAIGSFKALTDIALKAPVTVTKQAAIEAIGDERVLADIVRHSSDEGICREALKKVGNPDALAAIAVAEARKAIGLAALERISDREVLSRIEGKAGHKAVRARARAMLGTETADTPPPEIDPERLAHAERVQLTATMEGLSRAQDFRRAEEFAAAVRRFEHVGVGDDQALAARFRTAQTRYSEGLERYQVRRAAEIEAEAQAAALEASSDPAPESVAANSAPAGDASASAAADVSAPAADATTSSTADVSASEADVGAPSSADVSAPAADVSASAADVSAAPEPVADEPSDGTPEPLATLDSTAVTRPVSQPAPGEDEAVDAGDDAAELAQPGIASDPNADSDADREKPDRLEKKGPPLPVTPEEMRIYLESLAQNLESLVGSDKLKTINRGLARAEKRFNALGSPPTRMAEQLARLERARQALLIRAGEIREAMEWQMWANIAKQEQLIERATKLAADPAASKLGDRLRNLQTEWKALGPAPRDKAQDLWEKFKVASDVIYARVKEERKEENAERKANLAAKVALCEQAEALSSSEDWAETAQQLKALQAEWKKVGPVPRRQSDRLWKRFRGACDKFFERRKPHLEERLAEFRDAIDEKNSLVEEMEALISEEARQTDWQPRANRFDDLARQFSRAGRVPPREFATFRKRQDAVEKALKKERAQRRAAEEAKRAEAASSVAAAISDARARRESGALAGPDLAKTVLDLRAAARDLGGSDAAVAVQKQIEAEIVASVEAQPEAFTKTELDPVVSRQRKEKLCVKVEKLLPEQGAAPTSAEDMAAKLRAALADRALGGVLSKQADPGTVKRVVSEARESWARLGPVPGAAGAALEERFNGACERARRNTR